jgi:hypothetical protein
MNPGAPSPAASPYHDASDLALGGFVDRVSFVTFERDPKGVRGVIGSPILRIRGGRS